MVSATDLENELTANISELGLDDGGTVYVTGNLGALGTVRMKKSLKLESFFNAFMNNVGAEGTIFSPAASMNLCNTDIPFDINSTPSHEMGAFAEYIRTHPDSVRSNHPFWSIAGVGSQAKRLNRVTRHSYGAGSPWTHFIDLDATQVNMGVDPANAVTLIHHVETVVGVPYRYTKEFMHPIVVGDDVKVEPFYQAVFYADTNTRKRILRNQHYFAQLDTKGLLKKSQHSSGLEFTAFRMRDFYDVALKFFIDDIYNYLEEPPPIRPYTK